MPLPKTLLAVLFGLTAAFTLTACGETASSDAPNEPNDRMDHEGHMDHDDSGEHDHDHSGAAAPGTSALTNYVAAAYPLQTCVVAGGALGSMGEPVTLVHEGRVVKFCCAGCEPKFKADPDKYLEQIDAAVIEQQQAAYPLDTCLISGDALGDTPIDFVYENRLVRFCCDMCIETFLKDPNASLATLNEAAVKAQLADYPAKNCPVSGQPLGSMGEPINMMVGDKLIRLCCDGCVDKTQENPAAILDTVYGSPEAPGAE